MPPCPRGIFMQIEEAEETAAEIYAPDDVTLQFQFHATNDPEKKDWEATLDKAIEICAGTYNIAVAVAAAAAGRQWQVAGRQADGKYSSMHCTAQLVSTL